MLDGDGSLPEEEQKIEEVKFEIRQLFDFLELKIDDPALKKELGQQKLLVPQLLSHTDEAKTLPGEVTSELGKYSQILETAANQITDPIQYTEAQIKVAISNARIHYDSGKINTALELLGDPEEGAIVYVENVAVMSEELGLLHNKLDQLIDFISRSLR